MSNEAEKTERVRDQGCPEGLFRACMDTIRTSHTLGQSLRHAALAAGLLSDPKCYAELLCQFYLATAVLEKRIAELSKDDASNDSLVDKIHNLGYSFTQGYENDLQSLLGSEWNEIVQSWATEPTKQYLRRLESASEVDCVAAAFILHGPLIIGGGAVLKPRVQRCFGADATNVFDQVIGLERGGRSARRKEFITLYDTLLYTKESKEEAIDERFAAIVKACGEFMELNNLMMLAVRQRPWWTRYVAAGLIAVTTAVALRLVAGQSSTSETVLKLK